MGLKRRGYFTNISAITIAIPAMELAHGATDLGTCGVFRHKRRGAESQRACSSVPRSHRWCRPYAHWLNSVGFSFAHAGLDQLSSFLFFGRCRTDESGGPPPFEPSFKVEWDIGHIKASHPVHSGSTDFQLRHDLRQASFCRTAPNRPTKITFADMHAQDAFVPISRRVRERAANSELLHLASGLETPVSPFS